MAFASFDNAEERGVNTYDHRDQLLTSTIIAEGSAANTLTPVSHLYDPFNRRVVSRVAYDEDRDGTFGPAASSVGDETHARYKVYGGQSHWQVLEEFDADQNVIGPRASHIYGLYIDELLETQRDVNSVPGLGCWRPVRTWFCSMSRVWRAVFFGSGAKMSLNIEPWT